MNGQYFTIRINKNFLRMLFAVLLTASLLFISSVANASKVKMSASVAGWFEANQVNNETLEITTNMKTLVNTKECK